MKNHAEAATNLAQRLRLVMETDAKVVMRDKDVSGVGLAWRDGTIKFVVQTDSIEKAGSLRARLPERFQDFPLMIERPPLSEAASGPWLDEKAFKTRVAQDCQHPWLRRLARRLWPQQSWLAFARNRSAIQP